jgi:PAS domain S-box-containing protein
LNKRFITSVFGLALLTLFISTAQASTTSVTASYYSGLSLMLFVLVYYLLTRQIAKLKQAEAACQDLYNNAPCGYYSVTQDGAFIAINDTALRWLGYAREEIIGKIQISHLLVPEDLASGDFVRQFLAQTSVKERELRLLRKDGTILPVLMNATIVEDAERGTVIRTSFFDITERQQIEEALRQTNEALEVRVRHRTSELMEVIDRLQRELFQRERVERALRESEERWQLAIRGTNDGIWDWNLKTDEVFFSSRWKEMLGYQEQELGTTSKEWRQRVHPDDLEQVLQCCQDHITGRTSFYVTEHRLLCKDGSYKWILARGQALWDQKGDAIRLTGSHTDISDAKSAAIQRKQAEEALRKSQEQLQAILDYSPAVIYLTDTQHSYQLINRKFESLFNTTFAETLGKSVYEVWAPEIAEVFVRNSQQVIDQGIPLEFEEFASHQDGLHTYRSIKFPLYDINGIPCAVCGISTDISDVYDELRLRKIAEAERAKLIAILEATPDIVGTIDINERIHYLNSAARQIFSFGENNNCVNFTLADVQPEWSYEIVSNEGIPTAMRDGVWVGETAFLSHDGHEIPVSQLIVAHKSADGLVNMFSTIARDITQQKQISATLFEAERRWRSLLDNVHLVVVGLNQQGKVEYANHCFLELVGYSKTEVIGQDWLEIFLPTHQQKQMQNNLAELWSQEFNTHHNNVILTKSGEERVIAWNNTVLQDLQGNVIGTLSIGEDITERQVIERMKDEFISVVSHELRTPLTSIHGALNLLSSDLVDIKSDKGRRVLEIAAESAERLVRLVNDILELERLESGKISLSKQICHAPQLLEKAIEMMQVMANRAGITLLVSSMPVQFSADSDRIIQVLTNLLGNAIKFSARDTKIWLTVELVNRELLRENGVREFSVVSGSGLPMVLFKVQDQGRGIPEDKLESIFERFHQVDASDSRKKGGTGLGLGICRSIVQQHGGRIWVESTLSEGSSFYFTLPRQQLDDENYGK